MSRPGSMVFSWHQRQGPTCGAYVASLWQDNSTRNCLLPLSPPPLQPLESLPPPTPSQASRHRVSMEENFKATAHLAVRWRAALVAAQSSTSWSPLSPKFFLQITLSSWVDSSTGSPNPKEDICMELQDALAQDSRVKHASPAMACLC